MSRRASRLRPSALALAAGAFAAFAFAAPASALESGMITRGSGNVEATLTWDKADVGVSNPHLKITRAGAVAFDASIADVCPPGCFLVADNPQYPDASILHVAELDGDGEIEVIVDTYSGGAHCCTTARIYAFSTAQNAFVRSISHYWGNSGYDLVDLNGDQKPELSGGDDRFAYKFSSYAASAFPPRVLSYSHDPASGVGTIRDTTRKFRKLIRANAKRLLQEIRGSTADGTYETQGVVAAYVADEYLLGQGRVGRRVIHSARKRGLVRRGFEGRLLTFLRKLGYR